MTDTELEYDEGAFAEDLADFRQLKKQKSAIDAKMKSITERLEPFLLTLPGKKYEDEEGHARFIIRKGYPTFAGSQVEKLANTWAVSTDPTLASCGQLLKTHRSQRPGYAYVQIK